MGVPQCSVTSSVLRTELTPAPAPSRLSVWGLAAPSPNLPARPPAPILVPPRPTLCPASLTFSPRASAHLPNSPLLVMPSHSAVQALVCSPVRGQSSTPAFQPLVRLPLGQQAQSHTVSPLRIRTCEDRAGNKRECCPVLALCPALSRVLGLKLAHGGLPAALSRKDSPSPYLANEKTEAPGGYVAHRATQRGGQS